MTTQKLTLENVVDAELSRWLAEQNRLQDGGVERSAMPERIALLLLAMQARRLVNVLGDGKIFVVVEQA